MLLEHSISLLQDRHHIPLFLDGFLEVRVPLLAVLRGLENARLRGGRVLFRFLDVLVDGSDLLLELLDSRRREVLIAGGLALCFLVRLDVGLWEGEILERMIIVYNRGWRKGLLCSGSPGLNINSPGMVEEGVGLCSAGCWWYMIRLGWAIHQSITPDQLQFLTHGFSMTMIWPHDGSFYGTGSYEDHDRGTQGLSAAQDRTRITRHTGSFCGTRSYQNHGKSFCGTTSYNHDQVFLRHIKIVQTSQSHDLSMTWTARPDGSF